MAEHPNLGIKLLDRSISTAKIKATQQIKKVHTTTQISPFFVQSDTLEQVGLNFWVLLAITGMTTSAVLHPLVHLK